MISFRIEQEQNLLSRWRCQTYSKSHPSTKLETYLPVFDTIPVPSYSTLKLKAIRIDNLSYMVAREFEFRGSSTLPIHSYSNQLSNENGGGIHTKTRTSRNPRVHLILIILAIFLWIFPLGSTVLFGVLNEMESAVFSLYRPLSDSPGVRPIRLRT